MSSRSTTSSPDVLGPDGDSMYLISSPAPDFTGRQSWVAPHTFLTPGNKQRHPSRSPNKSSHTIRFDDIVLPSSPPMRIVNRQRSLSPTKLQSESNVSPWRIRVTVEAEHEDDENPQGSPRKKLKPTATTTKVPLKDEEGASVSPKKRRGRPRKSDMPQQVATPIKGSPGRTPKTKVPSTGKRPRGRPRKSVQTETVAQSIVTDGIVRNGETDLHAFDGALDVNSTTPIVTDDHALPSDGSSPLEGFVNDTATGDLGTVNSDNQVSPVPSTPIATHEPQSSGTRGVRIIEGASELTPIKTLSAARRLRGVSPENTLHAGHTPRPRKIYPTPTSSLLVDDEAGQSSRQSQRNSGRKIATDPTDDPTDDHREFDTIIESEGFSMVSLETLPSAKQGGLSSAQGPQKPFSERRMVDTGKPRASTSLSNAAINTSLATYTSPRRPQQTPAVAAVPSGVPPTPGPNQSKRKRTFPSLVRVIRAGLALQGILRRHRSEADPQSAFSSPTERDTSEDINGPRQRLEHLFSDFGPETQRELRAGLRFGEQLVRRQREVDRLQRKQNKRRRSIDTGANGSATGRVQQEIHWQHEREAVSRQIENANPDQVIIIDSDAGRPPPLERAAQEAAADDEEYEEDDFGDIWQQEARNRKSISGPSRVAQVPKALLPFELGGLHDPEDVPADYDGSGWESPHYQGGLDSWGSDVDNQSPIDDELSEYVWGEAPANDHFSRPNIPPLGKSRLSTLQPEDVDLSGLLRPQDTPNTRKYYANSSPQTTESQRLRPGVNTDRKIAPEHSSAGHADSSPVGTVGRTTEAQTGPSESDEISEEEESVDEGVGDEIDSVRRHRDITPDASPHPPSVVTPEVSKSSSRPSWFRRITDNFTPGWWVTAGQERVPLESSPSEPHFNEPVEETVKRSHDAAEVPSPDLSAEPASKKRKRTAPLATSGYFSDDHYRLLRHLYLRAKQSPDLFPYHPSPRRDDLLDDWLWTSDGEHGLRVAAIQFGIVDRFVQELSEADRAVGGRGEVGWTEEDLHKRLFSVIVGEQVRKERQEDAEAERLITR